MTTIRLRLAEGWHHYWLFWSVKLNGIGVLLLSAITIVQEAWNQMPPDLRHLIPYAQIVSIILFAAGIVARLVPQPAAQAKIVAKVTAKQEAANG